MEAKKEIIRLAIIFGGKSVEHEVSVASAKNIYHAVDKNKYRTSLIFIDKSGGWQKINDDFFGKEAISSPSPNQAGQSLPEIGLLANIDVAFPVLHGPFGEDGTIQGLFRTINIPFVGAGVLGSAIAMDKDIAKRLMKEAGIPVVKFMSFNQKSVPTFETVEEQVDLPFFVKPANLGSSVGISKVGRAEDFDSAVKMAFAYDSKIVVEEFIKGREIECSVLGNEDPEVSLPGEIIPNADFYSYDAKYTTTSGAELIIPAKLEVGKIEEIQELAKKAFEVLGCKSMARVDFFLRENGQLFVSEVNTIPGFTNISMYPKLWEASGLTYAELIDKLITLALERFSTEQKLKTSY